MFKFLPGQVWPWLVCRSSIQWTVRQSRHKHTQSGLLSWSQNWPCLPLFPANQDQKQQNKHFAKIPINLSTSSNKNITRLFSEPSFSFKFLFYSCVVLLKEKNCRKIGTFESKRVCYTNLKQLKNNNNNKHKHTKDRRG